MGIGENTFNPRASSGLFKYSAMAPEKQNRKREKTQPHKNNTFVIFHTMSFPFSILYLGKKYEKTLGRPAVKIINKEV
jgi:hypothetical protein